MKRSPSVTLGLSRGGRKTKKQKRAGAPWPKRLLFFMLKLFIAIHIAYIVLTSLFIFVYKYSDPKFTLLMPYRSIGYGWELQKPQPIRLENVPTFIKSMLVAVEDGKFYEHHGIDMEAFKRAREVNAKLGKPLYGGSTLTMQVARTLFLVPEKSYIRKYFEVIAALELELLLSKERILELYFGYAEWGKGIFGIEAAAKHYFGLPTRSLSRDQAARLIALLSSPIKYSPSTLSKSAILRERYAYLTRRFVSPYAVSPDQSSLPESPPGGIPEPGFEEAFIEGEDSEAVVDESLISPEETISAEPESVPEGTIEATPAAEPEETPVEPLDEPRDDTPAEGLDETSLDAALNQMLIPEA
jgi:monofunctional biosynthetic peptidoglycan transglycosylase